MKTIIKKMVFGALVIVGSLVVSQTSSAGTLFHLVSGNPLGQSGTPSQVGSSSGGTFSIRCDPSSSVCYLPMGGGTYWTPIDIYLVDGGDPISYDDIVGEYISSN